MIFTSIRKQNGICVIDGYSNKKTIKGALSDINKEVSKIDQSEAASLKQFGMDNVNKDFGDDCDYQISITEVPNASIYLNDEVVDYQEANFYCYIRFVL
jgi:hypothetical protein